MAVIVLKYGVHYRWLRQLPPAVDQQLHLGADLWNELVDVYETWTAAKIAVWSAYPEIAMVESLIATGETQVIELSAVVAQMRKDQRTKTPKGEAVSDLKAVKASLREAKAVRREAIGKVRTEARAQLIQIGDERNAAVKELYSKYSSKGLYWATINDITRRRWVVATKKIESARAQGRPAQLRHQRYNGSGTLTVQLQRGADAPTRTPSRLADAEHGAWRNVLRLPPSVTAETWDGLTRAQQRHCGRGEIRMRIGSDDDGGTQWVDVPVQMHRQIPADADVAEARLTIRRVGPDLRGAITIVAKTGDVEPVTDGPDVAFHLGWRAQDDGGVRVATWRATDDVDIPVALQDVMRVDPDGRTGTVVLPARVTARAEKLWQQVADRDAAFNVARDDVIKWMDETGQVLPSPYDPEVAVTTATLKQWRNPARFVALCRHLAADDAWVNTPPTEILTQWARRDRRAWAAVEHGRRRLLAHRDDLWAQVAAVIADQAGRLVVDDTNIAHLARVKDGDDNVPTVIAEAAARRRQLAAPGTLRARVVQSCLRDGVEVVEVSAQNLSRTHTCGHIQDGPPGWPVACGGCGRQYDPDAVATLTMLARALQ